MGTWGRWVVRILVVLFGLFLGATFVTSALRSASTLTMVGGLLTAVGFVGLYLWMAFTFRDRSHYAAVLPWISDVPGGFRGFRRANRQIDGFESYHEFEIGHLRALAERREALNQSPGMRWSSSIIMIVLFTGFILAPPDFGHGSLSQVLVPAFRILCVAMLLVCVRLFVKGLRNPTDRKAVAFLERTQPLPD
jgi:hypothetical protein